jgi:hypothetical protein
MMAFRSWREKVREWKGVVIIECGWKRRLGR